MKTHDYTAIIEFEVVKPSNADETIGDKITLNEFGEFNDENLRRGHSLLYLLDNPEHYRVSKLVMRGINYIIPLDRKKNYATEMAINQQM